nr:PREDICTED: uncharacterized protein LOC106702228 [Latimeria chalumnae]|eukprot:XP_014339865.1 PREDICTED: uncharacterized protein LOC106702228 [Latimeria chalumnae]
MSEKNGIPSALLEGLSVEEQMDRDAEDLMPQGEKTPQAAPATTSKEGSESQKLQLKNVRDLQNETTAEIKGKRLKKLKNLESPNVTDVSAAILNTFPAIFRENNETAISSDVTSPMQNDVPAVNHIAKNNNGGLPKNKSDVGNLKITKEKVAGSEEIHPLPFQKISNTEDVGNDIMMPSGSVEEGGVPCVEQVKFGNPAGEIGMESISNACKEETAGLITFSPIQSSSSEGNAGRWVVVRRSNRSVREMDKIIKEERG